MADRYLIGTGNRNWNDPLNWSETSGGAGGASVPTQADNCIFDANSGTGTITLNADANCASFDASALTSPVTVAGSVYLFNSHGSFTGSTSLTFNLTGTSYFLSRESGTITQGGAVLGWNRWYIDATGGTVTNGSDIDTDASLYLIKGTYDTGDFDVTILRIASETTSVFSLNLNSSYVRVRDYLYQAGVITLNAGTSTIDHDAIDHFRSKSGFTYHNLITSSRVIYGSGNVYQNLTINPNILQITTIYEITINGNLTINGTANSRMLVASIYNQGSTIVVNGAVNATYTDFFRLKFQGAANFDLSEIVGLCGDAGENSGIIFSGSRTLYHYTNGNTITFNDPSVWFTESGGQGSPAIYPPKVDDILIFDRNSFTEENINYTFTRSYAYQTLDFTDVSKNINLSNNAYYINLFGSFLLNEKVTFSNNTSTGRFVISGGSDKEFKTGDNRLFLLSHESYGKLTLLSDLNVFTRLFFYYGTVDFNGFNVTVSKPDTVAMNGGGTLYMGEGTVEINDTAGVPAGTTLVDLTGNVFAEESTILINVNTENNYIFKGNSKAFNRVRLSGSNPGNLDISGNNTIAELVIDPGRKVRITGGTAQNIGKITAKGTPEAPITITSSTTSPFNIVKTGRGLVNVENCNISYSNASPVYKFFAMYSVDGGNNIGWSFGEIGVAAEDLSMEEAEYLSGELIGLGLVRGTLSEIEDAEAIVCGDSVLSFDAAEHEDATSQLIGKGIVQPEYTEYEKMESDLKASSFSSFEASEDEQMGDPAGTLRAFEKIVHGSEFQAIIKSESKLL